MRSAKTARCGGSSRNCRSASRPPAASNRSRRASRPARRRRAPRRTSIPGSAIVSCPRRRRGWPSPPWAGWRRRRANQEPEEQRRTEGAPALHTLEDIVREALRPLLRSWLDEHLPALAEKLAREEIARIVQEAGLR